MTTALKIQILDSSLVPVVDVNFIEQEILQAQPRPVQPSVLQRAQNGKPTLFVIGDPWHEIDVTFRIHSGDTISRLTTLRSNARLGTILRVYPQYIDDPAMWFDCIISAEIPLNWLFSGRQVVGDIFTITFVEADQTASTVMDDDIVV